MVASGIRVLALGVFVANGRILAIRYPNKATGGVVYRPPGGTIEFGERGRDAVRREIREELHSDIDDLHFLGMVENIFGGNGRGDSAPVGHEIVLLFGGTLSRQDLYQQEAIPIVEDNDETYTAHWISLAACRAPGGPLLVPRDLLQQLPRA